MSAAGFLLLIAPRLVVSGAGQSFRYAQASKLPRYLMRILPDSLERPPHALFFTRELSKGGKS